MKKHLLSDMQGGFKETVVVKSKAKPRVIIETKQVTDYRLERDRVLWKIGDQETKQTLKLKYKL